MDKIDKILKILMKEYPGSFHKTDPFKTLVSCLLSLRTKDATTEKAASRLFKHAKTPEQILNLTEKQIQKLIYPVGFYKVKSKNLKKICRILIKDYNSKVPDSIEELLKLPGIGRKCATIIHTYGFGKFESIPTDIHVHIISNRLGLVNEKTPERTEQSLIRIIPTKYWYDINRLFVLHGQNICLTRKPKCEICLIKKYCGYYLKELS